MIYKKHNDNQGFNVNMYLSAGRYYPETNTFTNNSGGVQYNCSKFQFTPQEDVSFASVSLITPDNQTLQMIYKEQGESSVYQIDDCSSSSRQYPMKGYYTVKLTLDDQKIEERSFFLDIPGSVSGIPAPSAELELEDGNINQFVFSNITLNDSEEAGVDFEGENHSQLGGYYPFTEENFDRISISDVIDPTQVQGIYFGVSNSKKLYRFTYNWTAPTRKLTLEMQYKGEDYDTTADTDETSNSQFEFQGYKIKFEIQNDTGPDDVFITIDDENEQKASLPAGSNANSPTYELTSNTELSTGSHTISVKGNGNTLLSKTLELPELENMPKPNLTFIIDEEGEIGTVTIGGENLSIGDEFNWHVNLGVGSSYHSKNSSESSIDFSDLNIAENKLKSISCDIIKNGIGYNFVWPVIQLTQNTIELKMFHDLGSYDWNSHETPNSEISSKSYSIIYTVTNDENSPSSVTLDLGNGVVTSVNKVIGSEPGSATYETSLLGLRYGTSTITAKNDDETLLSKEFTFFDPAETPKPKLSFIIDDGKIGTVTLGGDNLPSGEGFSWQVELGINSVPHPKSSGELSIDFSDLNLTELNLSSVKCVLNKDGIINHYSWTVSNPTQKSISSFKFEKDKNSGLSEDLVFDIDETTRFLSLSVAKGTTSSLIPSFEFEGQSVSVNSETQESGVTSQDFSRYHIYKVTATDGSTIEYIVTVIKPAADTVLANDIMWQDYSSSNDPSSKSWSDANDYCQELTWADHDDWQMGTGTQLKSLFTKINSLTYNRKSSYYWSSTAYYSGEKHYALLYETYQECRFGSCTTYGRQKYDELADSERNLVRCMRDPFPVFTSFKFLASDNSGLDEDIVGTVSGNTINLTIPGGTDLTTLIATFETSANTVELNKASQTSGDTANDFSKGDMLYTMVTAEGWAKAYSVKTTIVYEKPVMTSFKFLAVDNDLLTSDLTGTISSSSIRVKDVPYGTDVSNLVATFTFSGTYDTPTAKVGSTVQTSGSTARSFSSSVTYNVADSHSSQSYSVSLEFGEPEGVEAFYNGTNSIWLQDNGDRPKKNLSDAKSYCRGLTIGNWDDWELPKISDLAYEYHGTVKSAPIPSGTYWVSDSAFSVSPPGGGSVRYDYPTAMKSSLGGITTGDAGTATALKYVKCIHDK